MANGKGTPRRTFLQQALATGVAIEAGAPGGVQAQSPPRPASRPAEEAVVFPRTFTGRHLQTIAFPLGGVAAGSLSLGGRGQLRDWEIFNRPDKGAVPSYAFPAIWARAAGKKPVAKVLESRIQPPYTGASGLGSENVPGLVRLDEARFTGEYPLARIDFADRELPVTVSLEAFSPFIPHDAEDSGLPVAVLRYRVTNPGAAPAAVTVGFAIENPIFLPDDKKSQDGRAIEYREDQRLAGLLYSNQALAGDHPMYGEFLVSLLDRGDARLTHWRGWPRSPWWNAPMLFWDDFSDDGMLGDEPDPRNHVGAFCAQRSVPPRRSVDFTFLLAWRFPNRTPDWCGWDAPKGDEHTIIGNHYAVRFPGAWEAASYAAENLPRLEAKTRLFVSSFRDSSLPAAVKDAASANLSTLASTVCFRTADGEFHGFEGVNDKRGCCFGNCTHVWNYETTTAHVFPSLARSLRSASFGYSMDDDGAIHFRQLLPGGKARSGYAAADGQMGQILHAYLDWSLSGDNEWLKGIWPRVKKALEFAWVRGGWDADKDGVLEGVQHNTYDVEFYGPNPDCGVLYLGALRACEEMARATGDNVSADEYRRLFDSGSRWIDANLFNGEFYIQKIRGFRTDEIAPHLRSSMGSEGTEHPEYQVGEGCLADQLLGQYLANVAGLGPLLSARNVHAALRSIFKYNYKPTLADHDSVQRTYALNDEAALVICDYGKAQRPRIPFPYYAEAWTGVEYSTASLFISEGLTREGIEVFNKVRARYDGEKRNPWDEPECGHHYARAMSAWSGLLGLSGFRYHGPDGSLRVAPRIGGGDFRCFWATGTGWGTFRLSRATFQLKVLHGALPLRSCELPARAGKSRVTVNASAVEHRLRQSSAGTTVEFSSLQTLEENAELRVDAIL
jgi:uncharacterized protein (DUF608 family)